MTVLDSSVAIDYLLDTGVAGEVEALMEREGVLAAPDLLTFEVLAVLRRAVLRSALTESRAAHAIEDLGEMPIELFPSLPLRERAWTLKDNMTAADALFVALAEQLGEPLATKDSGLASTASRHSTISVIALPG